MSTCLYSEDTTHDQTAVISWWYIVLAECQKKIGQVRFDCQLIFNWVLCDMVLADAQPISVDMSPQILSRKVKEYRMLTDALHCKYTRSSSASTSIRTKYHCSNNIVINIKIFLTMNLFVIGPNVISFKLQIYIFFEKCKSLMNQYSSNASQITWNFQLMNY